jgi:hypothetical protein
VNSNVSRLNAVVAMNISPNHFDRGKPFYPLVVNYIVLLAGFKDLAVRGTAGGEHLGELLRGTFARGTSQAATDEELGKLRDNLRKLLGPLQLRSEFTGSGVTVDIDTLAREVVSNVTYLSSFVMRSAGSLLILAHELTKEAPWRDRGPLCEFLRHARNAAAHGGAFNLHPNEPSQPARWGSFEIIRALNGTPLFKDTAGLGLLSPGDPVRLLWDIEQAYPAMSA